MAMGPVENELLNKPLAETVAAIGGLDLLTPKTSVNPGTLQECINYEISRESGYKLADGMMRYAGKAYNTVKRPVCGDLDLGEYTTNTTLRITQICDNSSNQIQLYEFDINADTLTEVDSIDSGFNVQDGMSTHNDWVALADAIPDYTSVLLDTSGGTFTTLDKDFINPARSSYNFSPSGDYLATCGSGELHVLEVTSANEFSRLDSITVVGGSLAVYGAEWSPDGGYIFVKRTTSTSGGGAHDLRVYSFDGSSLSLVDTTDSRSETVSAGLVVGYDGEYVFSSQSSEIEVYKFDSTAETLTYVQNIDVSISNNRVAFKPDNSGILAINAGGTAKFVEYDTSDDTFSIVATTSITSYSGGGADGQKLGKWFDDFIAYPTGIIKYDPDMQTLTNHKTFPVTTNASSAEIHTAFTTQGIPAEVYLGGEYRVATNSSPDTMIGTIKPIYISNDETDICYQIVSGTDSNLYDFGETLRLYPDRTDTDIYATITNQALKSYNDVQDYIDSYFTHNKGIAADSFRPPGSGPINALFELDDKVYAVRDIADGSNSTIYKTTDLADLDQAPEWEAVDMGYEVPFTDGTTTTFTVYDREFLDTDAAAPDPKLDELGSDAESVTNDNSDGSITGGKWQDTSAANDPSEDTSALAQRQHDRDVNSDEWLSTQTLRLTGFDMGDDRRVVDPVVGIKAEVRYKFTTNLAQDQSGLSARMSSAKLTNVEGTDNKADTTVYTADTEFDTWYTATLGGSTDTWNAGNLANRRVFDDDFGIDLIFQSQVDSSVGSLDSIRFQSSTHVAYVKLSVYFESGGEGVFFWDGSSDVSTADMVHIFKRDGNWDTETAEGVLSVYDVSDVNAISVTDEVRTAANGAGAIVGVVSEAPYVAHLPSSSEMEDEGGLARTIKANFSIDEEKEAVWGATGAGPAFTYDGQYFRNVRVPVPEVKDKPRHVAEHQQHLALGFRSGSILVSVAGEPTNFEGVDGASEWGFGDRVTGLVNLNGNALGIFCEQSTHALVGTSIDDFTQQSISKSTGAIEYSVVNMGQPIYCDFRGISSIAASERYGDFSWGRTSQLITDWLQPRLQEAADFSPGLERIKLAIPARNKNQYKLFFNDGNILTMTMFGPEGDQPMFTKQNMAFQGDVDMLPDRTYVPSCALSTVLSDGQELNMIGTEDGDIYILDQGTGILTNSEVVTYDALMIFNPFNGGAPHLNLKYHEVILHGLTSGFQELTCSAGVNYLVPATSAFEETRTMGASTDSVNLRRIPDRVSTHLPNVTDGFSLKIEATADGNIPHTIHALTYRPTPLSDRNAAPKQY